MASPSELLTRAAAAIPHPSPAQQQILDRLRELQTRFDERLLRVAVIGQFKRGKSTLLNALLGAPLLPTGVTPVTALPTFIGAGRQDRVRIAFSDGKPSIETVDTAAIPEVLERHISEAQNPRNRLAVENIAIEVRSDFLETGIVLIDTPGVGSTFLHNTRAAEAFLTQCDAALFVLSADPPITETEVNYLDKVEELVPKIFFILNKIDLLEAAEKNDAERFLADVLAARHPHAPPDRIFALSARRAFQAKAANGGGGLEASGLPKLEQALSGELAQEKRAILLATGRMRLISLVSELLFQTEIECKALLTPEKDLKRKAATFETSAVQIEADRQRMSDQLSLDRKRLLRELEAETDRVWNGAKGELRQTIFAVSDMPAGAQETRDKITATLGAYFEQALRDSVSLFQTQLDALVRVHRDRAGGLVNHVRKTAADLMEIPANLPRAEEAFQPRREPYWVAPEPAISLINLSTGAAARLLPRAVRERRAREKLIAEAERAALRNVANLNWCSRQNIEDSLRRFENEFSVQLGAALQATRQAMQLALQKRAVRSEAIEADVAQAKGSIAVLEQILSELPAAEAEPPPTDQAEGAQAC